MSQQILQRDASPAAPATDAEPESDDVERALLRVRALVDAAMSNHRRRSIARPLVESVLDDETVRTTLRRMVAGAREELICILPASWYATREPDIAVEELGRLAGAGVAVRLLCSPDGLRTVEGLRFLERAEAHGVQTRVAQSLTHELVMVDEWVALVRSNVDAAGQEAVIAHAPAILRTLGALFTGAWDAASPAAERRQPSVVVRDRLTRDVLGLLSAGYKDDAAARRLGLSVRTYRRHVADILRDLEAASRFQAGAKAAELGLVARPETDHPGQPTKPPSIWKTEPVM